MKIKQLLLLSLILTTGLIDANDDNEASTKITESATVIKTELLALHKKIVDLKVLLNRAQAEKEISWQTLKECWRKRNDEAKTLYFYQPYTINCSSCEQPFRENYVGASGDIEKDGSNKINVPINKLRHEYTTALSLYNESYQTFKRCNRYEDNACLNDLANELREWNKNN